MRLMCSGRSPWPLCCREENSPFPGRLWLICRLTSCKCSQMWRSPDQHTHDRQDLMVMWSSFHRYHMKASYCVNSRWALRQFNLGAAGTLTLKCYVRTGTDRWRQSELKGCKSKINWTHSWNSAKAWIQTVNWGQPCANANANWAWVNSSKEKINHQTSP